MCTTADWIVTVVTELMILTNKRFVGKIFKKIDQWIDSVEQN